MSAVSPPDPAPVPLGRDSGMTVDAVDGTALATHDGVAQPTARVPTQSAPPAIRVRLLEAELRAERRHAATTEERLRHVQATLQQALAQSEQHRIAVAELQTVLEATVPRLRTLEQALAERDRDGACRALERELAATRTAHAAELYRLRQEHAALADRLAATHTGTASDAQPRPHTTEQTLEHTLRELDEARLVPVELRAALGAAEHRATTLAARLAARDRTVDALRATRARIGHPLERAGAPHAPAPDAADHVRTLDTTIESLHAQLEERRITCIELQTVLDATERQLATVEATLAEREDERTARSGGPGTPGAEAERDPDTSHTELQDARQRVAELETQLRNTDTTLTQTLEQLEERRTAAIALDSLIRAGDQRIDALQATVARGDRELATLRAETEAQQERAAAEGAAARATIARLEGEGAALRDQLIERTAALAAATEREAGHRTAITEWAARHAALQSQLAAAEAGHRQLEHDVATLRDQQQRDADDIQHLRAEHGRLQRESEDVASRLFAARAEGAAAAQHSRDLEEEATTLRATVAQLRQLLAERDADTAAVRDEAGRTATALREFHDRRAALEEALQASTATCNAQEHALLSAESERDALRAQVANLNAAAGAFHDERHQLQQRIDTLIAEVGAAQQETDRVRRELTARERSAEDARQAHAAESNRDRETLERQAALLREAAGEREELTRQLAALGAAHTHASAELESLRTEHAMLVSPPRDDPAVALAPPPAPAAPSAAASTDRAETAGPASGPLTIVHIEDQPTGRDAVRAAVNRHAGTRYVCPQCPPAAAGRSATLFAINLLSRHLDPLAVIADAEKWGGQEPRAFTYASDSTRAAVLGLIEYFPFPFDPEACAARLLERPQGAHRVLTVSNHIELMTRLRTLLSSGRCSTTVALDGRQALDLVKPVNPEIVLIDLALPRGEGWDLINRLHAEPTTTAIPIALLWTQKLGSGIFRQYASRLVQDWRGAGTNIGTALQDLLHTRPPGTDAGLRSGWVERNDRPRWPARRHRPCCPGPHPRQENEPCWT